MKFWMRALSFVAVAAFSFAFAAATASERVTLMPTAPYDSASLTKSGT